MAVQNGDIPETRGRAKPSLSASARPEPGFAAGASGGLGSGRRFQRLRAHQGHEAHRQGGLLHQFALDPAIPHEGLGPAGGSQGNHQAAALFELRGEGRGHPGRRGGDQDGVKGGGLGPALVTVAGS